MMSLLFGLFTQVSGSGPLGPLVTPKVPKMKVVKLAHSIDLAEAAHHELPQLDLHCFPSDL